MLPDSRSAALARCPTFAPVPAGAFVFSDDGSPEYRADGTYAIGPAEAKPWGVLAMMAEAKLPPLPPMPAPETTAARRARNKALAKRGIPALRVALMPRQRPVLA